MHKTKLELSMLSYVCYSLQLHYIIHNAISLVKMTCKKFNNYLYQQSFPLTIHTLLLICREKLTDERLQYVPLP